MLIDSSININSCINSTVVDAPSAGKWGEATTIIIPTGGSATYTSNVRMVGKIVQYVRPWLYRRGGVVCLRVLWLLASF